ncbi:thymidylate synthase [Alcaligenes phage vB_Af_QDWS595]|uniref:Thymidylate synthase n=1 Tax=Alcaligenes phage vB_Af_QDWS595 TaxID=2877946 RepID=A0AAE9BZX9_9CAUD|nr:thymidylate synthase [Alcaligenes phage vB_Af_QDWS595]UCR75524.1 thymidylate synthase [Alcaligenes phage vB_Af_QDWS595]
MHHAEVSIIADSISQEGKRITTFQLRYWRGIHAEVKTHRIISQTPEMITTLELPCALMDYSEFSRNAGSSRARPSAAIIKQVSEDPWGPLHWGKNQPGMQANEEMDGTDKENAKFMWKSAAMSAASHAKTLMNLGAHKQIVNRILEPYTFIDVVVTSTSYDNFFALRIHPDADPTIQDLAQRMYDEYIKSDPVKLNVGDWHLPYITDEDVVQASGWIKDDDNRISLTLELLRKMSAARCARVSYALFDGSKANIEKDLELYDKLVGSQPIHASPTEHQATPDYKYADRWVDPEYWGNFDGWVQNRKLIKGEYIERYAP